MPLLKFTPEELKQNRRKNPFRTHPSVGRDEERMTPFPNPHIEPKFKFDNNDKIFAAGSCFARNIENALHSIDANIVSSDLDIPVPEGSNPFQFYNKYSVHTILNEFKWALEGTEFSADTHLIEMPKDKYCDLNISTNTVMSKDDCMKLRKKYNASFAQILKADVFILTLGLVEAWYDKKSKAYLNVAPNAILTKQHPDRFELHVLDYQDILDALRELKALLIKHCGSMPKTLVTVSPVALQATFREEDVIIANSYSKSVQRAAVEQFVTENRENDISYFPSYEIVTLSDNDQAWISKDFRHVQPENVRRIMGQVLKSYVGESKGQGFLTADGKAKGYFKAGLYQKAIDELQEYFEKHGETDFELLHLAVRSAVKVKRFDLALLYGEQAMAIGINDEDPKVQKIVGDLKKQTEIYGRKVNAVEQEKKPHQIAIEKIRLLATMAEEPEEMEWLINYVRENK